MKLLADYLRELVEGTRRGWNAFWFTPTDPATLGLIRILGGWMLFYTHAVWSLGLDDFFMADGWMGRDAMSALEAGGYQWSHFWWIDSPALLWGIHVFALVIFVMLMVGLYTRPVSILAFLLAVSYANRAPLALFGLDQINVMLAMYLMVGDSGRAYSLDRLLRRRLAGGELPRIEPSVSANIAIRLIQVHMCVIYFFAGVAKLQGPAWWDGTAMWGAVANLEYQSIDATWLVHSLLAVNILTHATIFWEVTYAALVWPRLTRPIVIALAVPTHLGIAFFLGMITFGFAMLFGNLAFVSPWVVRAVIDRDGGASRRIRYQAA
ncbi:MAG: HTTM domain-containing protein [Pirellulales bacterium]|nr:HTTM domain-containing protein [Planctomycetales bacterium]